ncbi:MAG: hypothetical protein ABIQ39_02045 [Ilumatobacteraceae bacterium]
MRDLDRAAVKAKGAHRKHTRSQRIAADTDPRQLRRPRPMREHALQDWAA